MTLRNYILLGVGVIAFIYFLGRKDGKAKGNTSNQAEVDTDFIDPNLDVDGFAEKLFRLMDGMFPNYTERARALTTLFNMNDNELKAVYNAFNANHGGGLSLPMWIADEYFTGGDNIADRLAARFTSLNLL